MTKEELKEKYRTEWYLYSQRAEIDELHVIECIDDAAKFWLSKLDEYASLSEHSSLSGSDELEKLNKEK